MASPSVTGRSDPKARAEEIASSRQEYRWELGHPTGIPLLYGMIPNDPGVLEKVRAFTRALPREERPGPFYLLNRALFGLKFLWKTRNWGNLGPRNLQTLEDWEDLYRHYRKPWSMRNWRRDEAFAYQRVAGPNPVWIRQVRSKQELPRFNWRALGEQVDGTPTDAAIEGGKLYSCDYALHEGIPATQPGALFDHVPSPIALFHVDPKNELQPLAIQLEQDSSCPLVRPGSDRGRPTNDGWVDRIDWAIAKALVQVAEFNAHQMCTHLTRTHLIEEVFLVSMRRTLARCHPVLVLLLPHFRNLLWNNFGGRQLLLPRGGWVAQILAGGAPGATEAIRRSYHGYEIGGETRFEPWSFEMWDLKRDLCRRGVADGERLPEYPYRDDGVQVWDAVEAFVGDYLGAYYDDDGDVTSDHEIQDWIYELVREAKVRGLPVDDAGAWDLHRAEAIRQADTRAVDRPSGVQTLSQLRRILTRILWTAGPQHSAINFAQYDYMQYVPNMPAALYGKRPLCNPNASDPVAEALSAIMPKGNQARMQLFTIDLLTDYRYDRLARYLWMDFPDPRSWDAIGAYIEKLDEAEERILAAQATRKGFGFTYAALRPSLITNSTSM